MKAFVSYKAVGDSDVRWLVLYELGSVMLEKGALLLAARGTSSSIEWAKHDIRREVGADVELIDTQQPMSQEDQATYDAVRAAYALVRSES